MVGRDQSGRLPHAPLGAVPFNGAADASRRGETDPNQDFAVFAAAALCNQCTFWNDMALRGGQKIRPLPEAFNRGRGR
jgi:hypothetical protein